MLFIVIIVQQLGVNSQCHCGRLAYSDTAIISLYRSHFKQYSQLTGQGHLLHSYTMKTCSKFRTLCHQVQVLLVLMQETTADTFALLLTLWTTLYNSSTLSVLMV